MSCPRCKSDETADRQQISRTDKMRTNIRLVGRSVVALVAMASLPAAATDLRLVDAAKNHDTEAVRRLLKQGVPVNASQPDGFTALHWAAQRDEADMADLLIRAGGTVRAADND